MSEQSERGHVVGEMRIWAVHNHWAPMHTGGLFHFQQVERQIFTGIDWVPWDSQEGIEAYNSALRAK